MFGKAGRAETATDPAPLEMFETTIRFKPKSEWRAGMTQEDIANEIRDKLKFLPGVEIAISQPIAARVDEMVSGVRSQVAVKIFGDDLGQLKRLGDEIAALLMGTPGATDLRVERVSGQDFLSIRIDRGAIARYGLNVQEVNDLIEIAVQGKVATQVFEGERRFDAVVRLPSAERNSVEDIGNLILRAPNGSIVALRDISHIELTDGPAQISREAGRRRLVIGVNVQGRDLGGFVAEARGRIERLVNLPTG